MHRKFVNAGDIFLQCSGLAKRFRLVSDNNKPSVHKNFTQSGKNTNHSLIPSKNIRISYAIFFHPQPATIQPVYTVHIRSNWIYYISCFFFFLISNFFSNEFLVPTYGLRCKPRLSAKLPSQTSKTTREWFAALRRACKHV